MKKLLAVMCVTSLIMFLSSPLMAGGIDNRTNWSAEYVRTFNRNAATDAADIALYNPAGTAEMDDGFYVNLSVHYINKVYENNINPGQNVIHGAYTKASEQDEPSYIPGLFLVYKKARWSVFSAFSNHGGGGEVDFSNGSFSARQLAYGMWSGNAQIAAICGGPGAISNELTKAKSHYKGYSFGAAYQLNDMFAVSLGTKTIDAYREATVRATSGGFGVTETASYEEDADGSGLVLGMNISPSDDLNIGIHYETKVGLDFKQSVTQDSLNLMPLLGPSFGIVDGAEVARDLPAILGVGLSYRFSEKIRVETDFTLYYNESADWNGDEDTVDNGYDLGITLEYVLNDQWLASIGYLYTSIGMKDPQNIQPELPELDANTIGGGVAWKFSDAWTFNFAIGNAFYDSDSYTYNPSVAVNDTITFEKNNFFLGFGVEYAMKGM